MNVRLLAVLLAAAHAAAAQTYPVETVIQRGHSDNIRVIQFSHDSQFMVTGSDDHNVKIWDLRSFREIRTFKGHENPLKVAHINRENTFILSATANVSGASDIMVFDIYTGKPYKTIETGNWNVGAILRDKAEMSFTLQALVLAPDGETIAWGEDNYGVKIGSVSRKKFERILETNWYPNALAFSPDGKLLAAGPDENGKRTGADTREILIWNTKNWKPERKIATRYPTVKFLEYTNDGTQLACVSGDTANNHMAVLLAGENNQERYALEIRQAVDAFALESRGNFIAYATEKSGHTEIKVYPVPSASVFKTLTVDEPKIYALRFSPNGKVLVASGKSIHAFSTSTWEPLAHIRPPTKIDNIAINPEGPSLVMSRLDRGTASFFYLDLMSLEYKGIVSRPTRLYQFWQQDQPFLLKAEGNRIGKFDTEGRRNEGLLVPPLSPISELSDFKAGDEFVVGGEWDRGEIVFANLKTQAVQTLPTHKRGTTALALSGNLLATGGKDNKIFLYDLNTPAKTRELLGHNRPITVIDINADRSLIASGSSDDFVRLWDAKTGERLGAFLNHSNQIASLAFSPSGKYLISGSGDSIFGGRSELVRWDLKKKRLAHKVEGNDGYIKKVLFHPGESNYFSIGNDPLVRAWHTETGKPLYSIAPLDTNGFIIFTPDNYYAFTKSRQSLVHFVQGTKVFSLENFDLKYNRPDIILSRLGSTNETLRGAFNKAYLRRIRKLGFTEAQLSEELHTPDIRIIDQAAIPLTTDAAALRFSIEATDSKFLLDRLMVTQNDVPVFGTRGVKFSGTEKKKTQEISVPLVHGKNKIQVSVLNVKGAASSKETLVIYRTAEDSPPELHVIVACVARYKNPAMNLTYSVKDGKDFANIFAGAKGWGRVQIDSLFNEQMTRVNFKRLKAKLLKTRPQDHVVLLMAGHGMLDLNFDFYFASYDVDPEDPAATSVSYDDIEWLMDSIPALNKLVLLDACHSGGVDKEAIDEMAEEFIAQRAAAEAAENDKGADTRRLQRAVVTKEDKLKMNLYKTYAVNSNTIELMQEMFTNLSQGSGAVVISAAAGNSYALESAEWRNGVFTYALKEALLGRKADVNRDGKVSANELKPFVTRRVFELTEGRQKPTARNEAVEFDFVVVR